MDLPINHEQWCGITRVRKKVQIKIKVINYRVTKKLGPLSDALSDQFIEAWELTKYWSLKARTLSDQNNISSIKMAYKKITGVKWGQARRTNFGHLKHLRSYKNKIAFISSKWNGTFYTLIINTIFQIYLARATLEITRSYASIMRHDDLLVFNNLGMIFSISLLIGRCLFNFEIQKQIIKKEGE